MDSYDQEAPQSFWSKFPSNDVFPGRSLVSGKALKSLAQEMGYPNKDLLEKVVKWLEEGADIGCNAQFRVPTRVANYDSALQDGEKVTDCIADWCHKKFVYGPVKFDQVPFDAKFSPIMTRGKPNGSVRVILNLSAPKGSSVNDGVNPDDYPAIMSSTDQWIEVLNRAGRGCRFVKVDWSDAYKHISVRPEDCNLQWFQWLNRAFMELSLVFGCSSSAGIFDALNKIVIFIVAKKSGLNANFIIQHLDDCCAAAPKNSLLLEKFDSTFSEVACQLGIKLAPRTDKEKSFGPSYQGTVLGVTYNTRTWGWGIPEDKLARILIAIQKCRKGILK